MSREMMMIGAFLVTGVALAVRQTPAPAPAVPLLNTPAWQGTEPKYGEQLLLRRDPQSGNALLLKHSAHDGAYRYDARARTLTLVAEPVWLKAAGPIAECGKQVPPAKPLPPPAGRTVIASTESPGHHYAAVLSAEGPAPKSLLPPLGSGVPAGQRFHQLFSLPDGRAIGNPIRIPVRRPEDVLAVCWSAEENVVVYHDILFTHLSVIEIDP